MTRSRSLRHDLEEIARYAAREEAGAIVCGLPLNADGSRGPSAEAAFAFSRALRKYTPLKIYLHDEFLTTWEANEELIEADVSRKKRRTIIDQMAAVHILESFLPCPARSGAGAESRRIMRKATLAWIFGPLVVLMGVAGGLALFWIWAARPSTRPHGGLSASSSRRIVGEDDWPDAAQDGFIRSRRIFAYLGRGVTIREGTYDFTAAASPAQILRHLERGDFATVRVTFPEGFLIRQIAHRLFREKIIPDENRFLDLVTTHGNTLALRSRCRRTWRATCFRTHTAFRSDRATSRSRRRWSTHSTAVSRSRRRRMFAGVAARSLTL